MKNFTIRSFMNYLFNLETETNKLDDHYSLSLLRDILLLTELLASAVLPEWKIIHERAQFLVGWLEVQNKSSQKNLISLSEHSSLIHHSEKQIKPNKYLALHTKRHRDTKSASKRRSFMSAITLSRSPSYKCTKQQKNKTNEMFSKYLNHLLRRSVPQRNISVRFSTSPSLSAHL